MSQIEAQQIVDVMLKHGQVGLDTARFYINGTSEKVPFRPVLLRALKFTKVSYAIH